MQALILFALFGVFMGAVGGVISTSTDGILSLVTSQVKATRDYFEDAKNVWLKQVVPARMDIPYQTCPDGTTYAVTDPRAYLCQTQIAQLPEWMGANRGVVDPWRTPITGFVVRKEVPIYASSPNYVVSVPVTAMVLISLGPDKRIGTQLQSDLAALSASSAIKDVLRLSAPDPSTCTAAAYGSCDDIVVTFSNQESQQARWQEVRDAVDRIAAGALRNYDQQFKAMIVQLGPLYRSSSGNLFNASGQIVINNNNINSWQTLGVNPPSFATVNLNSSEARTQIGVDEEFRYLTAPVDQGGSGLAISFTVSSSTLGVSDTLTVTLGNSSSPWGLWTSGSGMLRYQKVVQATAGG